MKRMVIAAIMVAALVFGVIGYASGNPQNVLVTARVNPAFSMTINQNAVSFSPVNLGSVYTNNSTMITVKSNKLWDFSKSSVVATPLVPVLSESTSPTAGVNKPKGVSNITATYNLDLTLDQAYNLDPGVDYVATYTYTGVQQP